MLSGEEKPMPSGRNKKLVICVDSDGCALPTLPQRDGTIKVFREKWGANSAIVKAIEKLVASGNYSEVIVVSFSNRQTLEIDKENAHVRGEGGRRVGGENEKYHVAGSSAPMLVGFRDEVEKALDEKGIPVTLFRGLLGDVYQGKELGTVFQQMLTQATLRNPRSTEHNIPIFGYPDDLLNPDDRMGHFDGSKLNILYFLVHAINQQNPDSELDFHLFDDKKDILDPLGDFLTKDISGSSALSILPSTVTVSAYQYDLYDHVHGVTDSTSNPEKARWTVQGQGSPTEHTNYQAMLRELSRKKSDNGGIVRLAQDKNRDAIIALHQENTTAQSKVEQVDAQQSCGCGIWQFFKEKLSGHHKNQDSVSQSQQSAVKGQKRGC